MLSRYVFVDTTDRGDVLGAPSFPSKEIETLTLDGPVWNAFECACTAKLAIAWAIAV